MILRHKAQLKAEAENPKSGCPILRALCEGSGSRKLPGGILHRYIPVMPSGLKRFYGNGDLHFLTFSCYQRRPYLATPQAKYTFLSVLEQARKRHKFSITGYVLMPEHVHLLVSEPETMTPSRVSQVIKQNSSRKLKSAMRIEREPFWLTRFYDFNVRTEQKLVEKLRYMHRNPVSHGLVALPEQWEWSSFRHYLTGKPGIVEIDSGWRNQWKPN